MANFFSTWLGTSLFGSATQQKKGVQDVSPSTHGVVKPKPVTVDTSLQVSAVYACIKLLSETVSSLPLKVYDVDGANLVEDKTSKLSRAICWKPNAIDTPLEFRETLMLNLCTNGNAYFLIDQGLAAYTLQPLSASQMRVEQDENGTLTYKYTRDTGQVEYTADQICHIRFMGNGIMGLSPLDYAAGAISNQLATDDFGSNYFVNGAKPSGVLSTDMMLDDDQYSQMIQRFRALNEGSTNAHKTLLLEAGMKFQQIQLSPEAMMMLENKRMNIEDIARFYGVPSILINDNKDTTSWGAGIEQIMIGWLNTGLSPLLQRIEQRFERSLLAPGEVNKKRIKFDTTDFIRADAKGQAEFITKLVANGVMTRNEGRQRLDLSPVDGADELTMQINMASIDYQQGQSNEQ